MPPRRFRFWRSFFFFQAKDGIRDIGVTGVQTCALPISELGLCAVRMLPTVRKPSCAQAEFSSTPHPAFACQHPASPADGARLAILCHHTLSSDRKSVV